MKFYLLATLFVFFCAKSIAQEEEKQARCPASNVAFIMDMSKTTTNYHSLEKDVVQRIVDRFPENSRFSLVTFGTKATRRAAFESDTTAAAFKRIVANLKGKEEGEHSYLGKAIDALPRRFPIETGQREKNYLFVLTDGLWTGKKSNPAAGRKIRKKMSLFVPQGVRVALFGLGIRPGMAVLKGFFPIGKWRKNIHLLRRSSLGERNIKAKVKKAMDRACVGPAIRDCAKKADLGFILDRSASITKPHFKNDVLPFVQNMAKDFNISSDGVHAGVVVFGSAWDTKVEIPLGQHTDTNSFVSAVQKISYPRYQGTYINKALVVASDELFGSPPRSGIKRYALLLTDGNQTTGGKVAPWNTMLPEKAAEKLWKKKIDILAVGVGRIDKASLERITNNGKNGKVHLVKNFDELKKSIEFLMSFLCTVCKMNLVVVLDASGSTKSRYVAGKYVLLEMARLVKVKPGGSQMSVINFGEEGNLDLTFPPGGEQTYNSFRASLEGLQWEGRKTKIESGLELVEKAMSYSSDNGYKKAVVVITDALQTAGDIGEVRRQAAAIRKKGYPIKTLSLQTKRSLSREKLKPLRTLKYISGSEDGNFFIRSHPRGNLEDPAFVNDVAGTVTNVLRSICGKKEGQ